MSEPSSKASARWLPAIALAAGIAVAQPASAQLFFDWGGQQKVNDSGRMVVRISADHKPGEIIVSFSDRKLYLMTGQGLAISYPIAIPREQDRWEGQTSVSQKRENPSWTPTPSMLKENPKLPRWVPGGHPMNPLGNRALYLGSSLYRIHGTDAPWTIGTAVSKGCIRLYNKDAQDIYERTKVGAKVLVTWKNYQIAPVDGVEPVPTPSQAQAQAVAQQQEPSAAQPPRQSRASSSGIGRIYETGDVAPIEPRRRRKVVEEELDFSQPPRPQEVAQPAVVAPPAQRPSRAAREGQVRRDAAAKARPAPAKATLPVQQEPVGSGNTSVQAEAASVSASASAFGEASAIATASIPAAKPVVSDVTPAATPRQAPREVTEARAAATAVTPSPAAASAASPASPAVTRSPDAPPAVRASTPEAAAPRPSSREDMAERALKAAERAAAAAERAAAAAERAERAATSKAASAAVGGGAPD